MESYTPYTPETPASRYLRKDLTLSDAAFKCKFGFDRPKHLPSIASMYARKE